MLAKLFILGRPGSGKTTAFCRIKERAEEAGWLVDRERDYTILRNMFQNKDERKKFRATIHDGFDVVDFSVLETALLEVERFVKLHMLTTTEKKLIVMEFARDDYKAALNLMSPNFVQDTHTLFINATMGTCMMRIRDRIKNSKKADNHFISDKIMEEYYAYDNSEYMKSIANFEACVGEKEKKCARVIQYIENEDSVDNLYSTVDLFFDEMMERCNLSVPSDDIPYLVRPTNKAKETKYF